MKRGEGASLERLRYVREHPGLSDQEYGKAFGLKPSYVWVAMASIRHMLEVYPADSTMFWMNRRYAHALRNKEIATMLELQAFFIAGGSLKGIPNLGKKGIKHVTDAFYRWL